MQNQLNVFIAGVQKGGTTALHHYFKIHDQLQSGIQKELHIFDDEGVDWSQPDLTRLNDMFVQRDTVLDISPRLLYDATPIYIFWPSALERIRNYNPNAKFILLFRDPIQRAYSHWRMETARKHETLTFRDAIRSGRNRLQGQSINSQNQRIYTYVERGFYAQQVKRLLSLFPRDQVLFLKSSDLYQTPQHTLNAVSEFLGISPFQNVSPIKEHVGSKTYPRPSVEDVEYLRKCFIDGTLEFTQLSGLDTSDWMTCNNSNQWPA